MFFLDAAACKHGHQVIPYTQAFILSSSCSFPRLFQSQAAAYATLILAHFYGYSNPRQQPMHHSLLLTSMVISVECIPTNRYKLARICDEELEFFDSSKLSQAAAYVTLTLADRIAAC
jgi:hypothetical protein